MIEIQCIDFYGLKVSVFDKKQLIENIMYSIDNNIQKIYFGYNFAFTTLFKKNPELYYYDNSFDIMVTDGRLFYLFVKMMGFPLKFDISIANLTLLVLEIANANKYSIMLLGSNDETNKTATQNLRQKYNNIIVYEGINGYFSSIEEKSIVDQINKNSPDILLIGISSPKKEKFAFEWRKDLSPKIIIPCGGIIDVLANKVKLTPIFFKKIGLATLFRVIQEPRRFFWSSVLVTYETFIRIIPKVLYDVKIRKMNNFFIPQVYGIRRD